jgi:hypothetical protein
MNKPATCKIYLLLIKEALKEQSSNLYRNRQYEISTAPFLQNNGIQKT